MLMIQFESELLRVEGDGAADVLDLIANAPEAENQPVWLLLRRSRPIGPSRFCGCICHRLKLRLACELSQMSHLPHAVLAIAEPLQLGVGGNFRTGVEH